jgi:O-methyltransferase
MEIASLFFDKEWWINNLNADPPGLIGAGNGLGLFPDFGDFRSCIG